MSDITFPLLYVMGTESWQHPRLIKFVEEEITDDIEQMEHEESIIAVKKIFLDCFGADMIVSELGKTGEPHDTVFSVILKSMEEYSDFMLKWA